MALTDGHRVEIEFDGDWMAFVCPCAGRECFLNVDFEDGLYSFQVAHSSGYYGDRRYIESWINNSCDQFVFNGTTYLDIKSLSLAMWLFELELAGNDEAAIDDVLECVGPFFNEIQKQLFRGAR